MKNLISPESYEIANAYLEHGSIEAAANYLGITRGQVSEELGKKEVKRYIDKIYLDAGYRNRDKLAGILDEMIESKLEEAKESGMYTKKDLLELLQFAHKLRMDEIEAAAAQEKVISNQTNIQLNGDFGSGNYGILMDKLLGGKVIASQ